MLSKLMRAIAMMDAGRVFDQDDFTENEWLLIGSLKNKRSEMTLEKQKDAAGQNG